MRKTHDPSLKPGTYFEQVPIEEVVKKVGDHLALDRPPRKRSPIACPPVRYVLSPPAATRTRIVQGGEEMRYLLPVKRRRALHVGRPPAGFDGELSSRYPQLSVRVPPATLDRLRALATQEGRAMWRILADALEGYDGLKRRGGRSTRADASVPASRSSKSAEDTR
jgi:hypothetical protein